MYFNLIKYKDIQENINFKPENYKEFNTDAEVEKWAKPIYEKWAETYKNVEHNIKNILDNSVVSDSLACYFGYMHRQINNYLRCGKDTKENTYREMADIISIWIALTPAISKNIIIYRSIDEVQLNLMYEHYKKYRTPYQESGFMSCSLLKNICLNSDFSDNRYLLKIYAPKGIRGAYANFIARRNEQELLLQRDYYLEFVKKPYIDYINEKTAKIIFECKLIFF